MTGLRLYTWVCVTQGEQGPQLKLGALTADSSECVLGFIQYISAAIPWEEEQIMQVAMLLAAEQGGGGDVSVVTDWIQENKEQVLLCEYIAHEVTTEMLAHLFTEVIGAPEGFDMEDWQAKGLLDESKFEELAENLKSAVEATYATKH